MASYHEDHNLHGEERQGELQAQERLQRQVMELFAQLMGTGSLEGVPSGSAATSKKFIEQLEVVYPTPGEIERKEQCPVCMVPFEVKEELHELGCKHVFHTACLLAWLEKSNTCPLCRFELPLENEELEEQRLERERAKRREADVEKLHNSMFG